MISALATWFHRLACVAFAYRGANATLTMAGGSFAIGHCKRCGNARLVDSRSDYLAGDIVSFGR